MSDNFTYQSPDAKKYLQALLSYLDTKSEVALYDLLKVSTCAIDDSGSFSGKRWDAMYTTIYFEVPVEKFSSLKIDENTRNRLTNYCDIVMPRNIGFDVVAVEFLPSVGDEFGESTLEDDLGNFTSANKSFDLPDDILSKGKEMQHVYLYLYAIENYIRLFIEKVGIDTYGENYFSSFNITRSITNQINGRRRTEDKNRWVSIRGDSELFYLDFSELGSLIQNNWELFRDYFPDQAWIGTKLNELYSIRNLVAHNSYVGDHERDVLRVNFRSIVSQINTS